MKNTKISLIVIGAIIISIIILLSSYYIEPTSLESKTNGLDGEIKVGAILPLTEDLAHHGEENLLALKLATDDFNEFLKDNGESWHIKLIVEDSQTKPVVALEKLTSLNAKGIDAVVGIETSSSIRNVKGYLDSNNMVLVNCCSTAPALAIPNDGVFRLVPDDTKQGKAIAKIISDSNIKVVIPVWRGDTWGDGLKESSINSFVKRGGMADSGIRYNPEALEFSASTSLLSDKVRNYVDQHGAEKVAVLFLGFGETLQFFQSSSEHDILDDIRWFGSDGMTNDHRIIEDRIGLDFATNVKLTTLLFSVSENPVYDRVSNILTDFLGRSPSSYSYSSYDSLWIVGLSMLESQSSDASEIKKVIYSVADDYSGAIGDIKLNDAGDLAQSDYDIWGIRDNSWKILGTWYYSDDSIILKDG